jgi:hypothetical protein
MMNRFAFLVVFSIGLAIPAAGQVNSADTQKIEDIRHLMKVTGMERLQQSMTDQMMGALRQSLPSMPDEDERFDKMRDRLTEILGDELRKLNYATVMIEIYDKYFTAAEIKELIHFYNSPIGQKAIQILPALTQESIAKGVELGKTAGKKAMERWLEEFPELKKAGLPAGE